MEVGTTKKVDPEWVLNSYRDLYEKKVCTDFIVVSGDNIEFNVHRTHMLVSSDYFKSLILSNLSECANSKITLKNIHSIELGKILDYVYGIEVRLECESVIQLMEAADMLQIHSLFEIGVDFMKKNIDMENILEVFKFAKKYFPVQSDSIQSLHDEEIYDFLGNNILLMEEPLRNECLKICIAEDICCIISRGNDQENSDRSHQYFSYFELLLSWIDMQPVKTAAVEDVIAELKLSEDYYFEFPFCVFSKSKLIEYSKTLLGRSDYFQKEFIAAINYHSYAMRFQALILPSIDRICRGTSSHQLVISKEYSSRDVDIVDLLEYNSVYILEFENLKSVGQGGPLLDPPLEPKHKKINIEVPPGLCAVQCVNTDGHLFLGETRTSQCYLFDARIWKWCQIAPVECNGYLVQNFTLVASDVYVYSVGGTINSEYTDVVLKYSFYFNKWSCCSKLPDKVKEIGNCVKDKYIYFVAGNRLENSDSRNSIKMYKRTSFCSKMFCCLNRSTGKIQSLQDLPVALASVNVFFSKSFFWEPHENLLFVVAKEQFNDSFPVCMYRFNSNHWLEVRHTNIIDRSFFYPNEDQIVITEPYGNVITVSANDPVVANRSNNGDMEIYALSKELKYYVKWDGNEVNFDRFDATLMVALPTNLYQRKLVYASGLFLWDK